MTCNKHGTDAIWNMASGITYVLPSCVEEMCEPNVALAPSCVTAHPAGPQLLHPSGTATGAAACIASLIMYDHVSTGLAVFIRGISTFVDKFLVWMGASKF